MSETDVSIEEKIVELKLQAEEYNKLSDQDKIKNIDTYNKIVQERELCTSVINEFKKSITIDVTKSTTKKKQPTPDALMDKVHEIKIKMDSDDMKLDELIDLYTQLCDAKSKLDVHFTNKKMQIIKL